MIALKWGTATLPQSETYKRFAGLAGIVHLWQLENLMDMLLSLRVFPISQKFDVDGLTIGPRTSCHSTS